MNDTDKLVDVLMALKDAEITLSEVNILQPTLDEVFLTLTGDVSKDERGNQND
jgi:ABC-2 type transport system ATP-binding protein